eukprot:TRINITY_DN32172_c0_g1_i1.p1 TRINITY_DN32172_c0_g1~~TRINITY_DN32172_c0_g1_i1.p1  ORF type:complete len:379 (-),score=95.50 TRINITY_DN32172_c0_g1_i1:113-1249(-)
MAAPDYGGVADRAYDEAIPVETDDEELSTPASSAPSSPDGGEKRQQKSMGPPPSGPQPPPRGAEGGDSDSESSSSSGSSTPDSSVDGEDHTANDSSQAAAQISGAYNPDDFKGLKVSAEVEELFSYITRYKPHTIELDTMLKPFIPELIPSIGEVDAFIKMPRPDAQGASDLGLIRLDEPALNPSDPSILDLQLRSLSKHQDLEPMEVRSIEAAEKNPKEIENWIRRIDDLNRSKPAPVVQYSRRMPDIEQLMQVWPAELEEHLQECPVPDLGDLDLDLPSYIRLLCAILDIPVHSQLTESLHVMFTLYSEFKTNQHFSKAADAAMNDPYNFSNVAPFSQGPGGPNAAALSAAISAAGLGGPPVESMAPSRAPSPAGR